MGETDNLNNLFISKEARDVIRFLEHFETRQNLITWMKARPAVGATVHEVYGDTDTIVVIPTSNVDGALAVNCKENVFKGLHIVFVESLRPVDPYFNISRNVNMGMRRALRYNPAWVVYAGDDMIKVDGPEKLTSQLARIDESEYDTLFTTPEGHYHSVKANLGRQRFLRRIAFSYSYSKRSILRFERKFGITLFDSRASGYQQAFFHQGYRHWSIASLGIISGAYLSRTGGALFNETFVNDSCDVELSLRLTRNPERYSFVNYQISELAGATMGTGDARRLRMVANNAYLQELLEHNPGDYFPDGYEYNRILSHRDVSSRIDQRSGQ